MRNCGLNRCVKRRSYPLFPRTGIHWSRYGEVLVADSLLRLIGGMGAGLEITHVEPSRSMRETDDDHRTRDEFVVRFA